MVGEDRILELYLEVKYLYKGSPNVIVKLSEQRNRNLQGNIETILHAVGFSKLLMMLSPLLYTHTASLFAQKFLKP